MAFFDITLICKHCLKMYVYSKTELYRSRILKAIVLAVYIHTYIQTQSKILPRRYPGMRITLSNKQLWTNRGGSTRSTMQQSRGADCCNE